MSVPPLGTIDHWSRACQTHSVRIKVLWGAKCIWQSPNKLSQSHPCWSQGITVLQTLVLPRRGIMKTSSLSVLNCWWKDLHAHEIRPGFLVQSPFLLPKPFQEAQLAYSSTLLYFPLNTRHPTLHRHPVIVFKNKNESEMRWSSLKQSWRVLTATPWFPLVLQECLIQPARNLADL